MNCCGLDQSLDCYAQICSSSFSISTCFDLLILASDITSSDADIEVSSSDADIDVLMLVSIRVSVNVQYNFLGSIYVSYELYNLFNLAFCYHQNFNLG